MFSACASPNCRFHSRLDACHFYARCPARPLVAGGCLQTVTMIVASPTTAQSGTVAFAASSPLPLRQGDAGSALPVGSALLLIVLLLGTGFAGWSRKRRVAPAWLAGPGRGCGSATTLGALKVQASLRLDGHTRLHVVHWNGRELLVATTGSSAPVALDRTAPLAQSGEGRFP
jgi:hypothetical protein